MTRRTSKLFVALVVSGVFATVPLTTDASGLCNQGTSVAGGNAGPGLGWDVGSGQCNGDFTVASDAAFPGDTGAGIELGMRIEQRFQGQVNAPQHNGSSYEVQTGPSSPAGGPPVRAWWNFHHSIAYKSSIDSLDALTFTIRTDFGTSEPTQPVFNLLAMRSLIDDRHTPKSAGGFTDIYQTSQNPVFGWFTPCDVSPVAGCYDVNAEGAWTLTLTAVKDLQVVQVSICVHTPNAACAPPPPPPSAFNDLRRPNDITVGADLCGNGYQSINFKGQTGSAGDTWITLFDPVAGGGPYIVSGAVQTVRADVAIKPFNNKKGAGVVALYNVGPSLKALALIAYDNGNTDSLALGLVDQAGKFTVLKSAVAVNGIALCNWYRVELKVTLTGPDTFTATGTLSKHLTANNPNSGVGNLVAQVDLPETTLSINGLEQSGEVGLIASSYNAVVDSSATNFEVDF